jgi:diguanylate cyclase (GGDEF)-like protein/PAS domain S-box-containing protein
MMSIGLLIQSSLFSSIQGTFPPGMSFLFLLILPILQLIYQFQRTIHHLNTEKSFVSHFFSILSESHSNFEIVRIPYGKTTYVSADCELITGYSPKEFIQTAHLFESILHPDDLPAYKTAVSSNEKLNLMEFTVRLYHKDGSVHWIQGIGVRIFDEKSHTLMDHLIHLDITHQRNMQTSTKQAIQLMVQLNQHIKDMIWIEEYNPDRIIFMNQPFRKFFHYSSKKMKQNNYTYLELIHPEDMREALNKLQTLKVEHQPIELEYRVIQKDGQRRWVLARIIPFLDEHGCHIRNIGIATDCTAQKKVETELQFANETLTQLATNIRELFWIRDRYSKEFIYVNPLFEQYYAQSAAAFQNNLSLYYDQIYNDDRIWVQKAEENLFRYGKKFIGEYRLQLADKQIHWVRTQAYPVTNSDGVFYRVVGITEDITEWKRNENEIKDFAHQQTIVANLQKSALKYNDIQHFILDAFLAINQIFKVQYCTLLEYDRRNSIFILQASIGLSKDIFPVEPFRSENDCLPGFSLLNLDPVISSNLHQEQRFILPEFLNDLPIHSCISLTVPGTDRVYGVLTFYCEQEHTFLTSHINIIQAIASLISELNLRYQTEKALIASETQYRELIEVQNAGILILNPLGFIQYVNPAAEALFATPKDFLIGYAIDTLLDKENLRIYRAQHKKILQGGEITFEIILNKTLDFPKDVMITAIARANEKKEITKLINIMRDITQQKVQEEELVHLTMHDPLTGIYNRSFYESEIFRLENTDFFPISIIIGDVDNLKGTNDDFGHAMGDRLLAQVSSIMKSAFRPADVVARIGGDEFAMLMTNTNNQTAKKMVVRIQSKIDQANQQSEFPFHISLSLGVATSTRQNTLRTAIQKADLRMYAEKKTKKKR